MSVCPSHSPDGTDRHTDLIFGMEIKWEDIEVKFKGQGHRSKVKLTRSKIHFQCYIVLRSAVGMTHSLRSDL